MPLMKENRPHLVQQDKLFVLMPLMKESRHHLARQDKTPRHDAIDEKKTFIIRRDRTHLVVIVFFQQRK